MLYFYVRIYFFEHIMPDTSPELQQIQTPADLGEAVRQYRKNRRLTQDSVASLSNVSTGFLSDFENGKPTSEIGKVLHTLWTLGLDVYVMPRGGRLPETH
jgi:HTH-type transcriptional regulator/antitoxin HipB